MLFLMFYTFLCMQGVICSCGNSSIPISLPHDDQYQYQYDDFILSQDTFSDDCHVIKLYLGQSNLRGTIPTTIGHLPYLTHLHMTQNMMLVGTIPSEIGRLTALKIISFVQTSTTGSIPTEIGYLTNMVAFEFGLSSMRGVIPSQIGNLVEVNQTTEFLLLNDMINVIFDNIIIIYYCIIYA